MFELFWFQRTTGTMDISCRLQLGLRDHHEYLFFGKVVGPPVSFENKNILNTTTRYPRLR